MSTEINSSPEIDLQQHTAQASNLPFFMLQNGYKRCHSKSKQIHLVLNKNNENIMKAAFRFSAKWMRAFATHFQCRFVCAAALVNRMEWRLFSLFSSFSFDLGWE